MTDPIRAVLLDVPIISVVERAFVGALLALSPSVLVTVVTGDERTLARHASVEVRLDVGLGQRQPWRTAVDYHTHCTPVRFAPGRNTK